MKLHAIVIRHCAPRDSKESLVGYVLASDEERIRKHIDKELMAGIWSDRHHDSLAEPLKIHDDDYNEVGQETYNERMLRLRGEFHDPHLDYSDAYYGLTFYGWDEGKVLSQEQVKVLKDLGMVIDLG